MEMKFAFFKQQHVPKTPSELNMQKNPQPVPIYLCTTVSVHDGDSEETDEEEETYEAPLEMSFSSPSSSNSTPTCAVEDYFIFITSMGAKVVLILPSFFIVIYLGHRRWRQRPSGAAAGHSDIITYHVVTMEMLGLVAGAVCCVGVYTNQLRMITTGGAIYHLLAHGLILFHCLTCVERYLAVVHPVAYLGMRAVGVVRVRNVAIGCVWLISVGWLGLAAVKLNVLQIVLHFCFMIFCIAVIAFCSVSVLCALIRPRPGDGTGERGRVDQSKQRAFYTMMAIMGTLLLWVVGQLVIVCLDVSDILGHHTVCMLLLSEVWFSLPSSLVLPLLFLQRAGKLGCFCSRVKHLENLTP